MRRTVAKQALQQALWLRFAQATGVLLQQLPARFIERNAAVFCYFFKSSNVLKFKAFK
ncbi:hypothetical protein CTS44_25656 [Comamonas thiooxydans]|nr:hypothetical protein CTS44_25656 [Comamonas thiooxydans]